MPHIAPSSSSNISSITRKPLPPVYTPIPRPVNRAVDSRAESQKEGNAINAKWRIGWKTPLTMVATYVLALLLSITHLSIFLFLNNLLRTTNNLASPPPPLFLRRRSHSVCKQPWALRSPKNFGICFESLPEEFKWSRTSSPCEVPFSAVQMGCFAKCSCAFNLRSCDLGTSSCREFPSRCIDSCLATSNHQLNRNSDSAQDCCWWGQYRRNHEHSSRHYGPNAIWQRF